jgi:Tannase and feruloyl esterase
MMRYGMVFVSLLLLPTSALLGAADCSLLKTLRLPDTTITSAERVTSGTVEGPQMSPQQQGLPAFCRVIGILRPTSDSAINFEVWMPENNWNGRFLGVGNGGFAGSIGFQSLAGNLRRGFATAGSDTGHQAESEDASWAFGHPEKIKDFGWRAVHLTAQRAKDIVKAYYGRPQQKAYFDSCSDGGREALMEAQRFPEDYDGILAGAPAYSWTHMLASGVGIAQATLSDPRGYISSLKLPAIERATLDACDSLDGVKDRIISDPSQCHFDPSVLLCKGADSLDCLTQPQINSLKSYYSGGRDSHGGSLLPGLIAGDESGAWREWVVGEAPGTGAGSAFVQNYFRYMVTGDPRWNVLTANVDASLKAATEKTAVDLDATNPVLNRFASRGGKLILYHGWNDPAIPPGNTIAYYESVEKQMGQSQSESFMRLYMAPGVEHCAGGPGPSFFGQLGLPTAKGSKYGLFDALEDWVEKAVPAGEVVASKYAPGPKGDPVVTMTRPLCPYPAIAKYKGTGDTNDSTNFACSTK